MTSTSQTTFQWYEGSFDFHSPYQPSIFQFSSIETINPTEWLLVNAGDTTMSATLPAVDPGIDLFPASTSSKVDLAHAMSATLPAMDPGIDPFLTSTLSKVDLAHTMAYVGIATEPSDSWHFF